MRESWRTRARRWRGWLVPAVLLALVAIAVWWFAGQQVGVRRPAPRVATITPLPPPPPPPKKPPESRPTPKPEQDMPKPNAPVEKPVEAPKQAPDVAKQVTMNASAQAGSDAFNIGAGAGGGMLGNGGGNGIGGASYEQYLGYALQQAIQRDDRTRRLAFDVRADLWIAADGRIERVEITTSSGSDGTDDALREALRGLRLDTPPPPSLAMPVRVAIHGRRPV